MLAAVPRGSVVGRGGLAAGLHARPAHPPGPGADRARPAVHAITTQEACPAGQTFRTCSTSPHSQSQDPCRSAARVARSWTCSHWVSAKPMILDLLNYGTLGMLTREVLAGGR